MPSSRGVRWGVGGWLADGEALPHSGIALAIIRGRWGHRAVRPASGAVRSHRALSAPGSPSEQQPARHAAAAAVLVGASPNSDADIAMCAWEVSTVSWRRMQTWESSRAGTLRVPAGRAGDGCPGCSTEAFVGCGPSRRPWAGRYGPRPSAIGHRPSAISWILRPQASAGHLLGNAVVRQGAAVLMRMLVQPRRAVQATRCLDRRPPPRPTPRRRSVDVGARWNPRVEPTKSTPQQRTGDRVRHPAVSPLFSDA